MDRSAVTSTNIKTCGWHDNVLELEFRNGACYRYHGVPMNQYLELTESKSPGSYLRSVIIPNYKARAKVQAQTPIKE